MRLTLRAFVRRLRGHRSTRLTAEGLLFLLFALAVGVAAINTGNNLFYLLLAMMLSIILVSGIVAEHSLRRLAGHRHLPDFLVAKEAATVTLVLHNHRSHLPSWSLRVVDVTDGHDIERGLTIQQLLPGTSALHSYPLIPTRRGRLRLDGIRIVTSFPFGLFVKTAYYPLTDTIIVCPPITPLDDGLVDGILARGYEAHLHRRGSGNELYNLRLYHPGDDSRNIHWVSTAKTSQLIVRETESQYQQRATIYLATVAPDSHETVFEEAVGFTASLVFHLSRQGYHLRLIAGPFASSFGEGEAHLKSLLQALALCERCNPETARKNATELPCAQLDHEQAAVLAVQPWEEADCHEMTAPTVVFTSAMFPRAPHVVR
jgi:uncharacterized protein (DUF58 family)